jgi:hypothetical protein
MSILFFILFEGGQNIEKIFRFKNFSQIDGQFAV